MELYHVKNNINRTFTASYNDYNGDSFYGRDLANENI